jgi:putative FmdB family regulatory protein
MPIYEYLCPTCGLIEQLLPMSASDQATYICRCGAMADRVVSLAAMRPDSAWHFGEFVPGHGHLNSASKIARAKKARGIVELSGRNDIESMKKMAASARQGWDEQLSRQTRRHFEETIANSGVVDSFGELTSDAIRQLSSEPITSANDERLA